ncbi:MAG: four helix bundle protein [Bacteroidota bacterium]|nr:four helix bundle protein [Bacteroidota bacterium]
MAKEKDILPRIYNFGLAVIKYSRTFSNTRESHILAKQVIRSATSVGANVEEANASSSKADFLNKMNIALKEARESHYWLRMVRDAECSISSETENMIKEADELKRILGAIVSKMRKS